jgi:uncharacterized OsmC-like protein
MSAQELAASMRRVEAVLLRRPEAGLHADAPATARWAGGTRVISSHTNGTEMATDMPSELGGSGNHVTPGWLFRAGLASCTATRIAMAAAAQGIELETLELVASSRSDTRGMLGMATAEGEPVRAGPSDLELRVRIAARGVLPQHLRALVEDSCRCSPVTCAVQEALPLALHIEVENAG